MASKKTAPAAKKAKPERDEFGRFKTKLAAIVGVASKVVTKKEPVSNKILTKDLSKLFSRARAKSGNPIFLRAVNQRTSDIKDRYGYTFSYGRLLPEADREMILIAENDYGSGLFYLTYETMIGAQRRSSYFDASFEWEQIDPDHKDYPARMAEYDANRIKTLSTRLHYDGKIGCDPEVFVESAAGSMIPAFLFLPSKEKPARTPNWSKHFNGHGGTTMYWDGFQGEYTTKANYCLGYHGDSIAAGLRGIYDAARKRFKDSKLSLRSVFHLSPEILEGALDEHVAFGCMPSLNAYGLKVNMPPAREVPFRSAGGHIHFGIGKKNHPKAGKIVKALDAVLGVACVSLFAEFDDPNRRKLYGLPGEYRLPPHGIEYRTLSNAWLSHPLIMNMVFDLARKAVIFGKDDYFEKHWVATEEEVINCIINCDVKAAHKMMERNKEAFLQLLKASYSSAQPAELEMLYQVFIKGIRSAIKDPLDLTTNWRLESGWKPHSGVVGEPNARTFLYNRRNDSECKM